MTLSRAAMAVALPLLLLSALVHAQTVVNFAALPACAQQCSNLVTAQQGCVPPQAAVTNQQTYTSCFCQSAFLTTLYSAPTGVCDTACPSTADQTTIQQWYINFCKNGVGGVSSSATVAGSSATASSTTSVGGLTGASTSGNTGDSINGAEDSSSYSGSWISSHWKWVVMLVVIFLAMVFFSIFGLWLKRRHRARRDALRANLAAPDAYISPVPAPPAMAHLKEGEDAGTLSSTIDLGSTAAGGTPRRGRSRTNTLTRFPNGSMSNVTQPSPVVWGPHQHQAATRGYEYRTHTPSNTGSPIHSMPSTPVGGRRIGVGNGKERERTSQVINEDNEADADDDGRAYNAHPGVNPDRIEPARSATSTPIVEPGKDGKPRRKLSKR